MLVVFGLCICLVGWLWVCERACLGLVFYCNSVVSFVLVLCCYLVYVADS